MKIRFIAIFVCSILGHNIFGQTVETVVEPFMVNSNFDSTYSIEPTIVAIENGEIIVSWINTESLDYNYGINEVKSFVKISKFDSFGNSIVNDDKIIGQNKFGSDGTTVIKYPKLFMNEEDLYAVVSWNEDYWGYEKIINTKINFDFNTQSEILSIYSGGYNYCDKKIFFLEDKILMFWDTWSEGSSKLFSQKIDNSNQLIGDKNEYYHIEKLGYLNSDVDISIINDNDFVFATSTQGNLNNWIYAGINSIDGGDFKKKWNLQKYPDSDSTFAGVIKTIKIDSGIFLIANTVLKIYSPNVLRIVLRKVNLDGTIIKSIDIKDENRIVKKDWNGLNLFKIKNNLLLIYETKVGIIGKLIDSDLKVLRKYEIHKFSTNIDEKNFNYYVQDNLLYITWDSDSDLNNIRNVWAKVLQLNGAANVETKTKIVFNLSQNYPNPFNPTTIIKYTILNVVNEKSHSLQNVTLKVYDVLGKEIATLVNVVKEQLTGSYEVEFDASNLSTGVYFYRLTIKSFAKTKKMILIR